MSLKAAGTSINFNGANLLSMAFECLKLVDVIHNGIQFLDTDRCLDINKIRRRRIRMSSKDFSHTSLET